MKRKNVFLSLIVFSVVLHAQDEKKEQFIHRGLFRAMGSIAEGAMLKQGVTNIYLTGNIEYYISDNISLRGDGNYFVSTMGEEKPFDYDHSILSGASYHFKTKSHFDPYVGLAPGISIVKLQQYQTILTGVFYESPQQSIDPLASMVVGYNLYFQNIFHLFMEARYIYGRHLSNYAPESLSELRFSFGLGFNLNFIKPVKK